MSTKNQKAVIHILKTQYSISDENYQQLLFDNFDVFSSTDLDEQQADEFIHLLNYEYSKDYRLGYNKGISKYLDCETFNKQFETLINLIEHREITKTEEKMFNLMTLKQQQELLNNLKARI